MQRKLIITLIAMSAAVTAAAQSSFSYPYMTFEKTDGSVVTMSVDEISVPLSQLKAKYFTTNTEVTDVCAVSTGVEVYMVNGIYKGRFATAEAARKALEPGTYLAHSHRNSSYTLTAGTTSSTVTA